MKVTWKLTLFLVLGMCIVLAIDAAVVMRRERLLLESDVYLDGRDTGQALASAVARVLDKDGEAQAREIVRRADKASTHLRFRWVRLHAAPGTPEGPHSSAGNLGDLEPGAASSLIVESNRKGEPLLLTYIPIVSGKRNVAALEVSEVLDDERRHLRNVIVNRVVTTLLLTALMGALAAAAGAWLIGRPISQLVAKARRVGEGDLTMPLNFTQKDEIGTLAGEIDAMCDRLASAQAGLTAETTARINAIEQLRHSDRLATVGQLASGLAHELGTPLNVVAQRAKMIATGEVTGTEAADGARIVFEQTQRITDVLRQLLDFARRRTPQPAPHDVQQLAEQTAAMLLPLAKKRSSTIHVDRGAPVQACIDRAQIQQVLTNLVMNGIQAMQEGGSVHIRVVQRHAVPPADVDLPASEQVCIEVEDAGPGIEPEMMPRIFEPFFTTKDVGEGTGLGLAVAYGIVRDHGGWIELKSELGRGSRFSVYLPLEPSAAEVHG